MDDSIHGHQVLEMMLTSEKKYSKAILEEDITSKFGKNATFHTCSISGMNVRELIDFFESKGKFKTLDDGFTTNRDNICDHE